MPLYKPAALIAASAVALSITNAASAQSISSRERIGQVLGALLGQTNSLDAQWMRGARPLSAGRAQFEARLDSDVRAGAVSSQAADRLSADYDNLVELEARYGADGRFTTQERADLTDRYGALTRSISEGGPVDFDTGPTVAEGRADFEARVNAALSARRISRTEATRLRSEYQALIQTEASYARDGISARERADLDTRLDALDARLGDGPAAVSPALNPRARLAALQAAVASGERSGALTRAEAADIRIEHGDLVRLEAAYSRTSPSADDHAYLVRRIGELESRARGIRR